MKSLGMKAMLAAAALAAAPGAWAQSVTLGPSSVIQGGAEAQPLGDTERWVTDADYPPEAKAAGESGMVGFAVTVDDSGMVSDCRVTRSSGSKLLDRATCKLIRRRGRFTAARNNNNEPVSAGWASSVTWSLWKEVPPAAGTTGTSG